MADVTIDELLRHVTATCQSSSLVESYSVYASDEDTLGVRVFLNDQTLINAFYNIATSKVAFAWVQEGKRLYGTDNTKMGWHVHPLESPDSHEACTAVDFATFPREVVALQSKTNTETK